MPLYDGTNPTAVGFATQKPHYDLLFNNAAALHDDHFPRGATRGAIIRTDPDISLAASRVALLKAGEVVFDDGFRDTVSTPLIAAIGTAGAGGLDTGAEAASTWYEIYCIRKPDGTKSLLLHRAKDYLVDATSSHTAGEDGSHVLRRATGPLNEKLAQGFKVSATGPCEFADLKLVRVGAVAAGTVVFAAIYADSGGGVPTGSALAVSDKIDASLISTTAQWIRLPFRTPVTLTAGVQYHLVLDGDYALSDTVHITWRADTTAAAYVGGSKAALSGGTWTADTDDDFLFKVSTTENDAAVVMPSGYTQKCRVGWVRNNGASNFVSFLAHDRFVTPIADQNSGDITSTTTAILIDWSAFVPPVPVRVRAGISNATLDTATAVAPVPDGYALQFAAGARSVGGGLWAYSTVATTAFPSSEAGDVLTEFQGLYGMVTASTGRIWNNAWGW